MITPRIEGEVSYTVWTTAEGDYAVVRYVEPETVARFATMTAAERKAAALNEQTARSGGKASKQRTAEGA